MSPEEQIRAWWERREALHDRYIAEANTYDLILQDLVQATEEAVSGVGVSFVTRSRVKNFDEFYRKLLARASQHTATDDPFLFITDILGLRVVTPFLEDINRVRDALQARFELIEIDDKAAALSIKEFGYNSIHLLVSLPQSVLDTHGPVSVRVAEIQLRTRMQDAWAEVEHELVYKTDLDSIDIQIRRKLLALNATLSLADTIFQEIRDYQQRRYRELVHRHRKMMNKVSTIPEKMGRVWRGEEPLSAGSTIHTPPTEGSPDSETSLSDLIVHALQSHLDADLEEAVALYSRVLAAQPSSAIFNHRGIAYLTMSEYDKAITDFTRVIEMMPTQSRAYTNRGLANRMIGHFSEAIADFDHSLELNPLWADTLYGRALTHYDLGNIPAALKDCDGAIALKPDFKQVLRFKRFIQDADL